MRWSPDVLHSDRYGWVPGLNWVSLWSVVVPLLLTIRLHVPAGWFVWERRIWLWASSLSMSHLTAAEALDPRTVATRPEQCAVSLTRGERHSRGSQWWTCIIHPTSNRSHLITHPPGQSKHLLQRRRHSRIGHALTSPLGSICHSEHVLRLVLEQQRPAPLVPECPQQQRPAPLAYERSRKDWGWQNPCTPRSVFSGPFGFWWPPTSTSWIRDPTVPSQTVH